MIDSRAHRVSDAIRRALLPSGWILLCAAILRVITAMRYRIDSDEPQHLHVVWGWTHGLLQYRDVFDNHMPLFHVLAAPLLRVAGERPEALLLMRLGMLPLFGAALALTYRIARTCYTHEQAVWTTLIAAFVPTFFLTSSEFRPDTLWAVCWLAAVLVLVRSALTPRSGFLAGVFIGLAFSVSMKTSLLVVALIAGALATWFAMGARRPAVRSIAAVAAGMLVAPAAVTIFFAANGALADFFYGTLGHNLIWRWRVNRLLAYPCLLTLIVICVRELRRSDEPDSIIARRIFIFVTAHMYGATLFCLWPLVEREHWLPYVPLAAVGIAPLFRANARRMAFIAVEAALIIVLGSLWRDNTSESLRLIDETLRLTSPSDAVVDLKGETVFRRRAFHYVLEPITKQRIRAGELIDSLAEDTIARGALVAAGDDGAYPHRASRFLRENFIAAGTLRVAGCALPARSGTFTIRIPARYAVTGGDASSIMIDGQRYRGPRHFKAGVHTFQSHKQNEALVLMWARAVELGFTPAVVGRTHR